MIAGSTVRINDEDRQVLRRLAEDEGETMQAVLSKALDAYRRQRILEQINTSFEALRRDPGAWQSLEKERSEWDATLLDGLDQGERWNDDGHVVTVGEGERQ